MTNFDRTQDDPIEGLDARMASDLTNLYAAPVPAMRFQRTEPGPHNWRSHLLRRTWRPTVAVAAAALAVAAVLVGPSLWSGESQVNAETIFARSTAAAQTNAPAAGPQRYHLIATTKSAGQTIAITTETWYVDSTHQRTENVSAADGSPDFGVSVDGADAWMYGDFSGTLRAVHGPASELGTSFVSQAPGSSLGQLLGQYNGNCQKAEQDGEDTVAGRSAYRIVVSHDLATCPAFAGTAEDAKYKIGTLVMDVDKETFLPLMTEQQFGAGGPPAYTYTVTQIEVGGNIPDTTFTYAPPDGVIVVDVADLTQAKNILSGYAIDGIPPEQPSTSAPDEPPLDIKPTPAP